MYLKAITTGIARCIRVIQFNDKNAGIISEKSFNLPYNAIHENDVHLRMLERELIDRLNAAGIVFTRNGGSNTLPGLMSLSFPGKSGEVILHRLDLMGISIPTGSACDSKNTEISHVLKAIKLDEELALGTVRISLGKNNTQEEVAQIANALYNKSHSRLTGDC